MGDAARILDAARTKGWRMATAESCTGGLIAGALTDVPGSSDVVECGYVTYSDTAKMRMLGVNATTLEAHGAVSEQVAREMARGALAGVDLAVSVTGIAGPGGSDVKPEGMVCFAIATPTHVASETVLFGPLGRSAVRAATVAHALHLIRMACIS